MSNGISTKSKVTLPREVAEAIDRLRGSGHDNEYIVMAATHDMIGGSNYDCIALYNYGDFDTLLSALVNGYTVEKSPEELEAERHERVEEYFRDLLSKARCDIRDGNVTKYYAMRIAVKETLSLLGITIEGINDK